VQTAAAAKGPALWVFPTADLFIMSETVNDENPNMTF